MFYHKDFFFPSFIYSKETESTIVTKKAGNQLIQLLHIVPYGQNADHTAVTLDL